MTDAARARAAFEAFLDRTLSELEGRDDVVGLVGMGSTAQRGRVDEWSDHDLAVVVRPGAHERYRDARGWLPDADRIALAVREWHDGVKVLYDDGHVVELGVATPDELRAWHADAHEVFFDRGGAADAVTEAATKPRPKGVAHASDELAVLLVSLVIGVGRARRGELLNASATIRGAAVEALATAVASSFAPERDVEIDSLDVIRRFDARYPAIASRIAQLQASDVEECARGLLDLAEEVFGGGMPSRGVAAVRGRLGWAARDPSQPPS